VRRSVQRTSTPATGAVDDDRKASQHAGWLPSGIRPAGAPNVVDA